MLVISIMKLRKKKDEAELASFRGGGGNLLRRFFFFFFPPVYFCFSTRKTIDSESLFFGRPSHRLHLACCLGLALLLWLQTATAVGALVVDISNVIQPKCARRPSSLLLRDTEQRLKASGGERRRRRRENEDRPSHLIAFKRERKKKGVG